MQPSGTTGAVEGASSVFCVLVVSRNGRVMVNYWAGDPEAKSPSPVEGEWDTPGVAKLVVGYQVLLRFPDTAEMGLGDTALCCVANGAHSTVVLVAAVPPCGTPPATHGLLAAAAHLSNIFENRHRNLLEQQAGEEQDQRQQDAAMSSQQVLRDSDTQGPRMPPTDAEFIPFESAIRATLFDASASLPGMARGAVVPGTLCATAFNVLSGASIFDFTNPEAVAPPLHAPAGDAVRHPFDTGITASDWYLLRGLYAPGSGVLWRAAQQMCLKHHSEMAGKVERITFVGAAGAEVDCVVRLERVLQAGEVVVAAVAAFMSGGGAGGRCAKPADYLDAFAVSFPLRSVERREIAPDSQQHRAFEASTSGMQALPKPQQHQDVGSGGGGGAKPPAALRPAPPPGGNPLQVGGSP